MEYYGVVNSDVRMDEMERCVYAKGEFSFIGMTVVWGTASPRSGGCTRRCALFSGSSWTNGKILNRPSVLFRI